MQDSILQPSVALMLLTFVVWVYMYILRLKWIAQNDESAEHLNTPEKLNAVVPERINRPSNNFKNLCELPIIFYALCVFLYVLNLVDQLFIALAWAFAGLRLVHSSIHCVVNNVPLRFASYLFSCLVLWAMVFRFAIIIL